MKITSLDIFKNVLFILIIIFSLQSFTKADDIRDFEIEGLSIGDSLLNFASEKKIKSSISSNQYSNNKYIIYFKITKEYGRPL